ncbi:phosphate ABC transporter permease PstA [Actinospica durhamensis]|uniref:Phosphate transport system permease protein PstA n=1 Tax=Actinospica durhamensis TaxID=1508375 RepID=A0A941EWW5_9ACTN|nr:phosphate ABC transporter permease PstA [Actinospica durhamensis]MBR7836484.1 phosphate ABC transporter permease PstA [Actinospica durhamensis]
MTELSTVAAPPAPPAAHTPRPGRPAEDPDLGRRIRRRSVTLDGVCAVLGSLLASFGLVWLIYERILPLTGAVGFALVWYAVFLLFLGTVTAMLWGRRAVTDRIVAALMVTLGLIIVALILDQVGYVAFTGRHALFHWNFVTQTMAEVGPLDPFTHGGVWHAMVGSLEQMGIATALAVPLGILAALFLVEVGGPMAQAVRALIQAMTSLPEIVAGLFVYALVVLTLGLPKSGFAAAIALTIMMIPFVARSSEVMLRLVPRSLREASYALGASQWRTVWTVVLPTARSGLTTAVVLGMARAIGETAPLLLVDGLNNYMNADPFQHWQTSLPLYIFEFVRYPQDAERVRAFGAAAVLMALVLILFTLARVLGGKAPGELTRRQKRQMARDRALAAAARAAAEEGGDHGAA